MTTDYYIIDRLSTMGIGFILSIPSEGGAATISLSPKQVIEFSKDGALFLANQNCTSKKNYLAWMQADRSVQCSGTTKAGKRCKKIVPGGADVDARTFESMLGARCDLH